MKYVNCRPIHNLEIRRIPINTALAAQLKNLRLFLNSNVGFSDPVAILYKIVAQGTQVGAKKIGNNI